MIKRKLFSLLGVNGEATLTLPDGRVGILQSVERESGSGSSFNVRVLVNGRSETVYVTADD